MIKFQNVTKEYRNHNVTKALDDITFEIADGEFVFVVGTSGAGKSTIIKLLIREELPSSGQIFLNDVEITSLRKKGLPLLRREIGVVFQDYKLLQHRTVYENVAFALEVAGQKNTEVKDVTSYVLDLVGLESRAYNFPHQLSGGERQRVAIARALVNDPQILIADEPTGNLDPENGWEVIQLLNKVNNWGTTVIMATHDDTVVNSLQKRVIELVDGKIIRDEGKGNYKNGNASEKKPLESKDKSAEDKIKGTKKETKDLKVKEEKEKQDKPKSEKESK